MKNITRYGYTKEEYDACINEVEKSTRTIIGEISICVGFFELLLVIYSIFTRTNLSWLNYAMIAALSFVYGLVVLKKDFMPHTIWNKLLAYIYISVVYGGAIMIGINSGAGPSTSIVVMLAVLPLLIVDNPICVCLLSGTACAIFLVHSYQLNSSEIFHVDLINGLMFLLIGSYAHVILSRMRIRNCLDSLQLMKTKEELCSVVDGIPSGICMFQYNFEKKKMVPLVISDIFCNMLGWEKEEFFQNYNQIMDDNILEEYKNELGVKLKKALDETVQSSKAHFIFDFEMKTKTGEIVGVQMRANNKKEDDSTIVISAVYSDVTKEMQEKKEILKNFEDMQFRWDNFESDAVGKSAFNITKNELMQHESLDTSIHGLAKGISEKEVNSMILAGVDDSEDRIRIRNFYNVEWLQQQFKKGKKYVTLEYRKRNKEDQVIWVLASQNLVLHPVTGDLISYVFVKNIQLKKQREAAYASAIQEEYEAAIYVECRTGISYIMSTSFENDTDEKTIIQHHYDEENDRYAMLNIEEEQREDYLAQTKLSTVRSKLFQEDFYSTSFRVKNDKDGERVKEIKYYYPKGEDSIVIAVRRDITNITREQVKQEDRFKKALINAEKANAAKSDFLARMSHDIRTPMNAIIGVSGLALEEDLEENTLAEFRKIHSAGEFLLGLVNDILDMTKIERETIEIKLEPYCFDEFIDNIQTNIGQQCEEKNIKFEILDDFNSNVKKQMLMWDKLRLNQIILNLLSNAVKFTPKGGTVTLNMSQLSHEEEEKVRIQFQVKDTGIGIGKDFLPHIFESFTQESEEIKTEYQGSGLGLSIANKLVELMGGTITVESEKGKGSCFTVILDSIVSDQTQEDIQNENLSNISELKGKRILLTEDNPLNLEIAKMVLEKAEILVEEAHDGLECVRKFEENPKGYYDCILMDIRMPNMGGLEATRRIRKSRKMDAKVIPIIAMTANAFEEDRESSLEAGMNDHLSKPFELEQLYRTILRHLR